MISRVDDRDALARLLAQPRAVLYKHSPICWQSALAARQVRRFVDACDDIPVYELDVVAHRDLARQAAAALGIPHESPQAIVLADGRAVWHASHLGVRARALRKAIEDVP